MALISEQNVSEGESETLTSKLSPLDLNIKGAQDLNTYLPQVAGGPETLGDALNVDYSTGVSSGLGLTLGPIQDMQQADGINTPVHNPNFDISGGSVAPAPTFDYALAPTFAPAPTLTPAPVFSPAYSLPVLESSLSSSSYASSMSLPETVFDQPGVTWFSNNAPGFQPSDGPTSGAGTDPVNPVFPGCFSLPMNTYQGIPAIYANSGFVRPGTLSNLTIQPFEQADSVHLNGMFSNMSLCQPNIQHEY